MCRHLHDLRWLAPCLDALKAKNRAEFVRQLAKANLSDEPEKVWGDEPGARSYRLDLGWSEVEAVQPSIQLLSLRSRDLVGEAGDSIAELAVKNGLPDIHTPLWIPPALDAVMNKVCHAWRASIFTDVSGSCLILQCADNSVLGPGRLQTGHGERMALRPRGVRVWQPGARCGAQTEPRVGGKRSTNVPHFARVTDQEGVEGGCRGHHKPDSGAEWH